MFAQLEFRGRRFAREDVPLLDYQGAEFVLVGARREPEQAYDIALEPCSEDYQHAEVIRRLRIVGGGAVTAEQIVGNACLNPGWKGGSFGA